MTDFQTWEKAYLSMDLLRFTTAGSVDDGKSTLIGRLLYDSKGIFEDQLEAIELTSKRKGEEHINLALITDGLKAEREQGITIDVAYRFFALPKRKFIIADTPGHIQYTRNMVTGASTANLSILLIDARNGISEQTLRHSYIASLLRINHVILCINKMDLVDYSRKVYDKIKSDYKEIAKKLKIQNLHIIPISALLGDNVVNKSENMPWYKGQTLLSKLETININNDINYRDARFPVQYIIRPQSTELHDYRGYAGQIVSGSFQSGDAITVLPSGLTSRIKSIDTYEGQFPVAYAPKSITMTLDSDIDVSRGDIIVKPDNLPYTGQDLNLMICWFNEKPLNNSGKYILRHTTNEMKCIIKNIHYKMNINTLEKDFADKKIQMNDIANISIKTTKPVIYDKYTTNRNTGSLILIEEGTNETVAAGMIM